MCFLLLLVFAVVSCGERENTDLSKPYVLKVKMKETDCFRCVQGQITMRDFSEVADVEIVFNGLNDKTISRFLEANALEYVKETDGFKIISDEEVYAKLNTIPSVSEGHLFDKKGREIMVFQFRLDKAAMSRLNAIQRKGKALMQNEPVSLKTDFDNSGVDFSVQGSFYVLTNKPMNLCQVFNMDGELVREIDGNLVDPSDVFPELQELNPKTLNFIKEIGQYKSSIEQAFINGREIWIGSFVSSPALEENSVNLYSYYQLLSFPLYDSLQLFKVIFDGRPNVTTTTFNHSNGDDTFIILMKNDEVVPVCNQAKCEVRDGKMVLLDEQPIHYPEFDRQKSLLYKPTLKDGLLNLMFTEYLVNVQSDTVFTLPFQYNTKIVDNGGFNIKITMDACLEDWAFDGEKIGVIYYNMVEGEKSQCHYLSWQKGQNGFLDKVITLPDEKIIALRLVLPDVANYLTKDNKVGTIVME